MISSDRLTPEQKTVVHHSEGPAVVLAVPGAGKTTALVHRIRHLIEERGVEPARILASSFSRATVQDLTSALESLGLQSVSVRTLHSLGHSLLSHASSSSSFKTDEPTAPGTPEKKAYVLARRALQERAEERDLRRSDLGVSPSTLVDQVAAWKQQLAYADLERAGVPDAARDVARQAHHQNEELLTLFRRFEAHRRAEDWVTFPDMLREGWECLVGNSTLQSRIQDRYDHVLVDEFQDVSRAQFQILDLLTASHRNYMVVGDDDQSIYQWRGADPSFLLSFAERYEAQEYLLTASFRLPASPLTVANAAIVHNDDRHSKQTRLTRGFDGTTELLEGSDPADTAAQLAETVETLHTVEGHSLDDMTVLVRTYGQTPPIERALVEREVPYRICGHLPFYRRQEVQTILHYLYWGVLERRRQRRGWFEHEQKATHYTDRFRRIANRPNRYIHNSRVDHVAERALDREAPILEILAGQVPEMHEETAERTQDFLAVAESLVNRLETPAGEVIEWLVDALDYKSFLRDHSPFPDLGEARVRTVRALSRYAGAFETVPALLQQIRSLASQRRSDEVGAVLEIRSIHRAKGAEWPVVFVAGCTEGTLLPQPNNRGDLDLEEERRLFYVAVTRSRERLYLCTHRSSPRSRFLDEANAEWLLKQCHWIRSGLQTDPTALSDEGMARLCQAVAELELDHYFKNWWAPSPAHAEALQHRLRALRPSIEEAREKRSAIQRAQEEYEASVEELRDDVHNRIASLRETLGTVPIPATHEHTETAYPDGAPVTFDWDESNTRVRVLGQDSAVGSIDPFGMSHLDASTFLELPWSRLVGSIVKVTRGGRELRLRIDWTASKARMMEERRETLSPPPTLSDRAQLLSNEAFEKGYSLLYRRLSERTETDCSG